jgi:hypothetical protein
MKGLKTYICFAIVILSALAFALTSCGGGGGAGGGGVSDTGASLTTANAPQAGSAVAQSVALVQSANFLINHDITFDIQSASISSKTSKSYSKSPLMRILNKAISISKTQGDKSGMHTAGSMPTTVVDCLESGSVTISNAKWTDNTTDPTDFINLSANITANACTETPYIWNGSMSVAFEGPLSAPTKLTVSMPSFTSTNTDPTPNETLTMTNLTIVVIPTGTEGSIDLLSGLPDATMTFTGTVSGKVNGTTSNPGNPLNVQCNNFIIAMSNSGETISLSGKIRPTCLGGLVTVTTNKPIVQAAGADCPTDGEIVLTSTANTNSVKIAIAADSKISIFYNNNNTPVQTYNSCTNIVGLCGG